MPTQDEMSALKRGNTELLEALMDMCCQYLGTIDDSSICNHDFMNAGENALDVLHRAGMAKELDDASYELLWSALEQRKAI